MPPEDINTEDDIREALQSAANQPNLHTSELQTSEAGEIPNAASASSGSLTQENHQNPSQVLRYTLMKCGLMAEKYPWQTTVILLSAVGCGWVCSYFGWTVLGAAVLYAANAEE